MWIFDIDRLCIVWANAAALALWGAETLTALRARDFSDISESERRRLSASIAQGPNREERSELWTLYPQGKPVTVQCTGSAFELDDGRTGVLVEANFPNDAVLSPLELRGIAALRHASIPISFFNLQGELLAENPAAHETFEPQGSAALDARFVDRQLSRWILAEIVEQRGFLTEAEVRTKQGVRWHALDGSLVQDPATGQPCILVSQVDVTHRRAAEDDCRLAGNRFLQLCMQAPMAIYELDLFVQCVFVNPAWSKLTGLSEAASIGGGWMAGLHPEDSERVVREWTEAIRECREHSCKFRCLHTDGQQRWLSARAVPLRDEAGVVTGFLGTVTDVTEHVLAEQRMLQAQGYRVHTADGCRAALALLAENNDTIGAVLVDQRMPQHDGLDFFYMAREQGYLEHARCHLLLSGEQLRGAELQSAGFAGCIGKPVFPSDLTRLLADGPLRSSVVTLQTGRSSAPAAPLRVLVAEDHEINAHLVLALLKRQGHRATLVSNGALALEALAAHTFDVVLMDVQMPVMDGLQAVRLLREREAAGASRTTVIALTANAMLGDQEACLQAGMDAYVAKPIDPALLQRALKSVVRSSVRPSRVMPISLLPVSPRPGGCFARAELLERVCGDMSFYAEMIKMFLASLDSMMVDLEASVHRGVDEDVRAAAHRMKGALQLVAASHAAPTAQALEFAAKEGWRDNYTVCMERLRGELRELSAVLLEELKAA